MALRFVDSFDDRDTAHVGAKYNNAPSGTIVANGRNSTSAWNKTGSDTGAVKSLDAQANWIVGMSLYFTSFASLGSRIIVQFTDSGASQCYLEVMSTGHIRATGHAGVIGTSSQALTLNAWNYIEVNVTISDTGSMEVHINEVDVLNLPNVDTKSTGNAWANSIELVKFYENVRVDDVYICDGTGAMNNDFLGDNRVECILPNGAGTPATAEWVSSGGGAAVVGNVDDNPPNDDTDYNLRDGSGLPLKDVWAFPAIASASGVINGVQVNTLNKKDDAGGVTCQHVTRSGGSDFNSADFNIPTGGYVYNSTIWEQNPNGPANWSVTTVNAAEFGYRRSA